MRIFKVVFLLTILHVANGSNAQATSSIKKAEACVEKGNLKGAIENYKIALANDSNNRAANLGLGLVYSEFLDNYATALPYLVKASNIAVSDSAYDLMFALGKCYQHSGNYLKALSYFNRLEGVQDLEQEKDFQKEVNKRKQDCLYARERENAAIDENIYLVNAGKNINSEMPEYVPVITNRNELIFTSKRQDEKKEEVNFMDGKYFESMYIAKIESNRFKDIRRYTLPDKYLNSKYYKHHQSVVSISQDGKKLFTFKGGKLYEIALDEREEQEPGEIKISKLNHYQNHAFLTKDGQTLYFTSDIPGGFGGNDIYKSQKTSSGEWGRPENLGETINTSFNEEAPFIANDGTLYFASEGHEGFGNYDIYKTYFADGKWSTPENLGKPINSSGHDIFLVFDSTYATGYFSSGRNGGFGDMDIYKILHLDKFDKSCPEEPIPNLFLSVIDSDTADFNCRFEVKLPKNFSLISAEWKINERSVTNNKYYLDYDSGNSGAYTVYTKIIAGCDTCLAPLVSCNTVTHSVQKIIPALPTIAAVDNSASEKKSDDGSNNAMNAKNTGSEFKPTPSSISALPSKQEFMDFENTHLLFDFNSTNINKNAAELLNANAQFLKENPLLLIEIVGHADARGSAMANARVSLQRALAVKNYLIAKGISPSRFIHITGKGSENLLNNCFTGVTCDEALHQQNRRVEFKIKTK